MWNNIYLYRILEKWGMVSRICLSKEEIEILRNMNENELPDDIFVEADNNGKRQYYRYPIISEQEINTRLNVFNAANIFTIKKCAVFYTTITIIFLSLYILFLLFSLRGC